MSETRISLLKINLQRYGSPRTLLSLSLSLSLSDLYLSVYLIGTVHTVNCT